MAVVLRKAGPVALAVLSLGAAHCARASKAPSARRAETGSSPACAEHPLPLAVGTAFSASTNDGDSAYEPSCVRGKGPECTYLVEVAQRSQLRAALLTLGFDGALSLRREHELGELACVDDTPLGDTNHARLEITLDPGRYLLVVDASDGGSGSFELFTELEPLPQREAVCAAASPLPDGMHVRGSTRGGASLFSQRCAGRESGPDHVYRLPLDRPSRVRVREESEFDAVLSLRSQCEELRELLCSDASPTGSAVLTAELVPGDYFLVLDGYSGRDAGDYVLAYERIPTPAAASEARQCSAAERLTQSPLGHELDTFYAPSAMAGTCGGEGAPERVFRLSLTQRRHVEIGLLDPELAAALYIRRRCGEASSEIACALLTPRERSSQSTEREPLLALDLDPGDYTVVVDGQSASDMGAATLFATEQPPISAAPRAP